ncbi:MAG: TolC family protein, partial [bacterium]
RGARLPTLSLSGNYQFLGQSDDFAFSAVERNTSFSATLDLQFNLFDGFATSARIQQAKAELSRIRHQKDELEQAIKIDIRQAVLRMTESQERIRSQLRSVHQAKKAYQIAEVRYNQGIGTQLELFDTRLALNNIKTNYLRAVFDYMIALTSWQKAVGIIQ